MVQPASNSPGTLTTPERTATFNVKGNSYDRGLEVTRLHPTLLAIGTAGLPELAGGNRALARGAAGAARSRGPGFTSTFHPGDFHSPLPGRRITDYARATAVDFCLGGAVVRHESVPRSRGLWAALFWRTAEPVCQLRLAQRVLRQSTAIAVCLPRPLAD